MSKQLSHYVARDIKGYEGLYAVTECGKIYSHSRVYKNGRLHKGRWMKPYVNNRGYECVGLTDREGKRIHQCVHILVALMFISNPNNLTLVNHKDEDKLNNHKDNLERCTHQYNVEYSCARHYRLQTPTGEIVDVFNLHTFCKANHLDNGAMYKVINGERKTHKGYRNIGVIVNE